MGKMTRKLARRGKDAARKAYDKLESKVMAAVGRKAVSSKVKGVKAVAKRAAKKALIAGGLAAAGVVAKEIRSRRKKPA
jgi:3-phosphoglycerate kinase